MARPQIAFVLRSDGLEYDDRIRKECVSLSKIADIHLFVLFDNNKEEEGITSYGIPYKSFKLVTREKFPSGKFLLVKAMEFYFRVKRYLKYFDLIWAHEEHTFLFSLFAQKNKLIWDLHELPVIFDRPLLRNIFNVIELRSRKILHANPHRIEYLIKKGFIKYPEKHNFIRNYPDNSFMCSSEKPQKFEVFLKWLAGSPYVYLQGISSPARNPFNSIASVLKVTPFKVVVVGSFNNAQVSGALEKEFGESYRERVYFTGMVNQLATPAYLSKAVFSMVFYHTNTPNNRYCEANRLYQSILMEVPVIVGCNEPMKELVNHNNYGIVLKSDGRDLIDLQGAITKIIKDRDHYVKSIRDKKNNILWERQEVLLFNLVNDK